MTTVFVAGGAGGVGEGVVRSWLRAGATVLTMSRNPERLTQLAASTRELGGTLITAQGSPTDPDAVASLSGEVSRFDQVVASIGGGGWQLAPLTVMGEAMFRRVIDDGITAHWAAANLLLPRVSAGGDYVFINGGAALEILAGAGPLSLVARGQLSLAAIYAAEHATRSLPITSLILNTPIATRSRASAPPQWLTPDQVGDACVRIHSMADVPEQIVLGGADDVASLS